MTNFDLEAHRKQFREIMEKYKARVVVCGGTGCMANGYGEIIEEFHRVMKEKGLSYAVAEAKEKADCYMAKSGCQGFCQMGPLVTIYPQEMLYVKVRPEDVAEIVETTLIGGKPVERLLYRDHEGADPVVKIHDIPFYAKQQRTTLRLCGMIDAEDIEEYIGNGGYKAAKKAVLSMTDEEICR